MILKNFTLSGLVKYFSQSIKCWESWAMDLLLQPGFVEILCRHYYPPPATKSDTEKFREHEYVALKVFVSRHRQAQNEEKVFRHLRAIKTNHPGAKGIRFLRDQFQLPGKYGPHECLVHEPLGLTLKDIREMSEGEKVSVQLLKPIIKYLFMALDFLHTKAQVVHTGKSTQLLC